jgi:hypothetical protein
LGIRNFFVFLRALVGRKKQEREEKGNKREKKYTGCSERRLIGPWLYGQQFPAKALSHLPRKMLLHGRNC